MEIDTNNNIDRPVTDRGGIIGGSSLGNFRVESSWACTRRLAYLYLRYPPTHEREYTDIMKLGHFYEKQLREWASKKLMSDITESAFVIHPEYPFIGGHPDGIYGDTGIIEIKTTNSNTFARLYNNGVYESYKDQLTLYMAITERYTAHFVIGCYDDISRKVIVEFKWDQNRYDWIIDQCVDFVCNIQDKLPDRCGKTKKGLTSACRRCEFRGECLPPTISKQ